MDFPPIGCVVLLWRSIARAAAPFALGAWRLSDGGDFVDNPGANWLQSPKRGARWSRSGLERFPDCTDTQQLQSATRGGHALRYRFAAAADLPTCQRLLGKGFRANPRVHARIPELWNSLLAVHPGNLSVIEDPERSHPDNIEAFAACAFVSDAFIAEFLAAPRPYLSAIIYERIL